MQQKLIDQWINALLTRFTLSKSETLQTLEEQRYIRQDAVNKRDLVNYLHDVLQLIKRLDYSKHEDLIMTYLRLNEILQMQFSLSHEIVSIFNMMILLNIKKSAWYQMYKNFSRSLDRESESRSELDKTSYRSYNLLIKSNYQSSARLSPRQIIYSIAAHFVDDEWEYDSINDIYHVVVQLFHFLNHILRNQDNTHDEDDAYVNWVNASSDHRCSHDECTHYHDWFSYMSWYFHIYKF